MATAHSMVALPSPLWPSKAVIWPWQKSRLSPRRAGWGLPGKHFSRPRTETPEFSRVGPLLSALREEGRINHGSPL